MGKLIVLERINLDDLRLGAAVRAAVAVGKMYLPDEAKERGAQVEFRVISAEYRDGSKEPIAVESFYRVAEA